MTIPCHCWPRLELIELWVAFSYPEWQILVFCLLGLDQNGDPFVPVESRSNRQEEFTVSDHLGILKVWQPLNLAHAIRQRAGERHEKQLAGKPCYKRHCKSCFYTNFGRMDRQLHGTSLFVFKKDSTFRRRVAYTCQQPIFKNFFLVLVLLNCITLAIQVGYTPCTSPVSPCITLAFQVEPAFDEESSLGRTLYLIDWVLVALFFVEVLFQAVAFQFILGQGAYLR